MRKLLPLLCLFASTALPAQSWKASTDKICRQTLKLINDARRQAGLQAVRISDTLSEGCRKHAQYLVTNAGKPEVEGLKAHEEVAALPGYSKAGAAAASASVIHFISPVPAVAGWFATFYHRIPLLQPQLTSVGIGWYGNAAGDTVALVDCIRGMNYALSDTLPVFFPAAGQTNVPLAFGGELPSPLPAGQTQAGYPITATFSGTVTNAKAKVTDAGGKEISCSVSSPEQPASSWEQWNTICIFPDKALLPQSLYTVTISCTLNGKPCQKKWSFKTGD